jgi:hypothetical protein
MKDDWTVVFARDRHKWTSGSGRYVRTSRGDQEGRFTVTGLAPAEYLVISADALEPREASDPEFLGRLETRAEIFAGKVKKTLDLKLRSLP